VQCVSSGHVHNRPCLTASVRTSVSNLVTARCRVLIICSQIFVTSFKHGVSSSYSGTVGGQAASVTLWSRRCSDLSDVPAATQLHYYHLVIVTMKTVDDDDLTLPYLTFRVGSFCKSPSAEAIFVAQSNAQPRCNFCLLIPLKGPSKPSFCSRSR